MPDFRTLVAQARTCRRFEEARPLQMADLEWLVDCARLTPCARNAQQLRYSLVGPGETCRRLFGIPHGLNIVCQAVILVTTVYSGVEYFVKNWDVFSEK